MYKLLIVDDEALMRQGILKLLNLRELNIHEVYEASNGLQGLELFELHKPQIVLIDINMPKMNGLELAKKIKANAPETRIAIITGYDYFDYAVTALKIGVEDYILKPISKQDVIDVLKKLIVLDQNMLSQKELLKVVEKIKTETHTHQDYNYKEIILEVLSKELYNSTFSLVKLAKEVGLNSSYLSVLFKEIFGSSFQDYVLNSRLDRAKLLLLTTGLKNYEIAQAVGIEDVNYFGVRFKQKYGYSPKQYKLKVSQHET